VAGETGFWDRDDEANNRYKNGKMRFQFWIELRSHLIKLYKLALDIEAEQAAKNENFEDLKYFEDFAVQKRRRSKRNQS
jgi:hypothetical protein